MEPSQLQGRRERNSHQAMLDEAACQHQQGCHDDIACRENASLMATKQRRQTAQHQRMGHAEAPYAQAEQSGRC